MSSRLCDVADVHYGRSPRDVLDEDGTIPVLGTGGLYGRAVRSLFTGPAVVVPRKGSLSNPQYVEGGFWPVDTTYAVLPKRGVDAKWLYYCLDGFDLTKLNEATGVPSISRDWLYKVPLGAVGIVQQQRIAEILTTIDDAIEQTDAVIAKTQQIKAGLMHDLFTRGVMPDGRLRPPRSEAPQLYKESPLGWIPKEWGPVRLGDATADSAPICYGIVQPGSHVHNGVPVVAIYNLNADFSDIHRCSPLIDSAYTRSRVRGGDVLLSIKGTIGRVDVTPAGFHGNISRDVGRLRPRPGLSAHYLRYALESPQMQRVLNRISVGSTRLELSIGRLKDVLVSVPAEGEQQRFVDRLIACDRVLEDERAKLIKLGQRKAGLMHDLLTGRVRVTPSDRA